MNIDMGRAAQPASLQQQVPTRKASLNFLSAFRAQVRRSPRMQGASCGPSRLTYSELWQRASELGCRLNAKANRPEPLIGVLSPRNLDLLTAIIAIFRCGGTYMPLDPKWPVARLQQLLTQSRARLLVVSAELYSAACEACERIPEVLRPELVPIETKGTPRLEGASQLLAASADHDLAYVIYTSGSSGRPKGVMIEHRGMFNHLVAKMSTLELTPKDCVAQTASQCFDISIWQFLSPLISGGRVHIVNDNMASDPAALLQTIAEERVTVVEAVPSFLALLLDELKERSGSSPVEHLRCVIVTGEEVPAKLCREWLRLFPRIPIINAYGPTECSDDVSQYSMSQYAAAERERIPIGSPMPNTSLFVLDEHFSPVPVGASGELVVGGFGVGRGYLNDPARTAQSFVPDFQGKGRLYRTGDLVRRAHDGNLEFLGRIDRQDKIRGFRVEPEEIEAALIRHPGIREAAVAVDRDPGGNKRLVGYVVPTLQRCPTVDGRRRYRLPNQLAVVHLNRNETEFLYREMFEVKAYFKHGINLNHGDCVLDVGANIGLFSLFVTLARKDTRIYAFEPNPHVFGLLRTNSALYNVSANLFEFGLAEQNRTAQFTFYPKLSFLSGLYADPKEDKEVVNSFIRHQTGQTESHSDNQGSGDLLAELLDDKFQSTTLKVQLRRLSDVMREEGIDRVDLLKINVEKAELDVLMGIDSADWCRIRQVALEVHDIDGRLDRVTTLLKEAGYFVAVEKDWSLEETAKSNYYVYARRDRLNTSAHAPINAVVPNGVLDAEEVRVYLAKELPAYLVPSQIVLLEKMPLTSNGKIDRSALNPNLASGTAESSGVDEARSSDEIFLQSIWKETLSRVNIGIHENFFEAGGHSLLALQVIDEIRKRSGRQIPMQAFFANPTIAQLALLLNDQGITPRSNHL